MKWEVPPHSSKGFQLIGTEKVNGEIYLLFMGSKVNRERVNLNSIESESKEIKSYVSLYLGKILSGVYDISLTKKTLE
ncbi:hypothetical protein [Sediminibacillus massiliensis]|uniref:hypothetical protein n=1 Tax=Sediminibacillus massiliensis TaxID=1926277 RepID=UPI000988372E|nr:hypothetical protein [Sediminibacillus massiliensis]